MNLLFTSFPYVFLFFKIENSINLYSELTQDISIVKFKLEAGLLAISLGLISGFRGVEELVDAVNGVSPNKSESPE